LEMTDKKDRGGQRDVDHTGKNQVSDWTGSMNRVLHCRCAS
jgi:hypothetical protein